MFSVDNFYEFFRSHYGWEKTNSLIYKFHVDGSKYFQDLRPYHDVDHYQSHGPAYFAAGGAIVMHDQEPFVPGLLNIYKQHRYQENKGAWWLHTHDHEAMLLATATCDWPILCHSELHSQDVAWAEDAGAIPCYYFWHAMISRDWFRHWRYHADLVNKKPNWQKRFLLYARDHTGSREYRQQVISQLMHMQDSISYNWQGLQQPSSALSATISVADSCNTAIHIVAETVFDQSKLHATEKIFKPMVMSQPFVVYAAPGMLQYLKSYGFKTFGDIWDESYDLDTDHHVRLQKVSDLIAQLNSISGTEFAEIVHRCQHIVQHNRNHFYSEKFESELINEMHTNMHCALATQRQRRTRDPGGSFFNVIDAGLRRNISLCKHTEHVLAQLCSTMKKTQPARAVSIGQQYSWAAPYLAQVYEQLNQG